LFTYARAIVFNALFYLSTIVWLIIGLPTFLMSYRGIVIVAKGWGRTNLWLLRTVAGIDYEIRGLEKVPPGAAIVAAKHQSAWETFALMTCFHDPAFILKRELQWIPIFGWFTIKGRMVPVDRRKGTQAIPAMIERARIELARGRQLLIFPEGTRRPAGAEPRYRYGVALIYGASDVPCVPVALNSGLFWPRRSLRMRPGKVLVEILDTIPAGLQRDEFFKLLQERIEPATARLIAEAERAA
jgi:1-acyl-sn-glycerol-3-phosphate acyltransferase